MKPLTQKQKDFLYDLYYNQKFLLGRDRLYAKVQQIEGTNRPSISRRQIMGWLKG